MNDRTNKSGYGNNLLRGNRIGSNNVKNSMKIKIHKESIACRSNLKVGNGTILVA